MYKLIRVFNVVQENNKVKSADYEVIHEFEEFEYDDVTEDMLIAVCKEKNLQYTDKQNSYTIVEYKNDKPVVIVGQLFYRPDNDEMGSWMRWAEWNERVIASTALGYDIVVSEETKKNIVMLYSKCRSNKCG